MSGIYIPDVSLPGEEDLWIVVRKDGSFTYNDREGEGWQDGKQKTVPVLAHGRLIDADALIQNKGVNTFSAVFAVATAPTIIPAAPGEEEAT